MRAMTSKDREEALAVLSQAPPASLTNEEDCAFWIDERKRVVEIRQKLQADRDAQIDPLLRERHLIREAFDPTIERLRDRESGLRHVINSYGGRVRRGITPRQNPTGSLWGQLKRRLGSWLSPSR